VQILKEPKNSLVAQYKYLFELDGIDLCFDNDAFLSIAEKAKELKTNARGLKNILENTLLPYQFDAINLVERGLTKIIISKSAVEGNPATLIFDKKNDKKQS
jgi:ATP-dependent Clp protease ATP-binding subunit ClpX